MQISPKYNLLLIFTINSKLNSFNLRTSFILMKKMISCQKKLKKPQKSSKTWIFTLSRKELILNFKVTYISTHFNNTGSSIIILSNFKNTYLRKDTASQSTIYSRPSKDMVLQTKLSNHFLIRILRLKIYWENEKRFKISIKILNFNSFLI